MDGVLVVWTRLVRVRPVCVCRSKGRLGQPTFYLGHKLRKSYRDDSVPGSVVREDLRVVSEISLTGTLVRQGVCHRCVVDPCEGGKRYFFKFVSSFNFWVYGWWI